MGFLTTKPSKSFASGATVLSVQDVRKSYEGRVVLRGISFEVKAGERVALVGPSGSGKTTLLNCLGGVDRPDGGSIELLGESIGTLSGDQLARLRRRRVGTIFQFFHLLPTLTVFENIELPLQLIGVGREERLGKVSSLIERVGLRHRLEALPGQLSGGEMQRVAIARALVHRPELLLADEPTGNLDSVNGQNVLELLRDLSCETGTALILVTHSVDATRICNRRILLKDGGIVSDQGGAS
jgi:ABC-type lipoprotein export system ATPase subunit